MTEDDEDHYDPSFDGENYDTIAWMDRAMSLSDQGDYKAALRVMEQGEAEMKKWAAWKEFRARERAIETVLREAWSATTRKVPVRPKQARVTLRLDEDVAKWFRRLGPNYGRRVNAVLRDYAILEGFRARR